MAKARDNYRTKLHCNDCLQKTNHAILSKHGSSGDTGYMVWQRDYYILQCSGCDNISFLDRYSDDGMVDENWNQLSQENIYPPRIARKIPDWLMNLEENEPELVAILREVYVALQNDLRILATQGTRTALESVIIKKVGDKGTFEKNVDAFIAADFMNKKLKQPMLDALDAGSAAAHRAYNPSKKDVSEIFDLVEVIIHTIFIIPEKAQAVKAKTPQRKKS